MSQPPPLGTAWRNLSLEQRAALPVGTCLRMSADEDDYHLWLDAAPRWTDADGRVDDPVDRAVIESYPALGPEEGGWCGEHPMRVERDTAGMLGYDTSDGADLCLACEVERLRGIEATARKVVAVCESDASSHQQRRLMIQALRVALAGGTPK